MNAGQLTQTPIKTQPQAVPRIDPLEVLHEVLELARESNPELDVEGMVAFAVANPDHRSSGFTGRSKYRLCPLRCVRT